MKQCPNCQAQNKPEARFCVQCGGAMGEQTKTLRLNTALRGRYKIEKLLAQGGMGAVYLATDEQLFNRHCVIKEMLPYYTNPEEKADAEHKFQREAQVLATLNHPNVPQIYEYFVEQDRYYLVMQFIDGQNLEQRLTSQGGRLPEREVLDYAKQMANVLTFTAQQASPVIHRDIKPANIILETATNQIKLVDFGIAREQSTNKTKTMVMGTHGYAPPEQYNGNTEPRTDIYALGATLHHLLTGRDPRLHAPFNFPVVQQLVPSVSAELNNLIGMMLDREVGNRPMASQLKLDLDHIMQTSGGGAISTQPFTMRSGAQINSAEELGIALDQHWDDGIYHLFNGHLEQWFQGRSRHDLANHCQQIRQSEQDQSAGLERLVRLLTPTMPLPTLQLDQQILNFGVVEKGNSDQLRLTIANQGRGYLHGQIKTLVPWATVSTQQVGSRKEQPQQVEVVIDTSELPEGQVEAPIVEITTNGGLQNVMAQMKVTWQPKLTVDPPILDFGELLVQEQGKRMQTTLNLANSGGSVLNGQLYSPVPWIQISPSQFSIAAGQAIQVQAFADTTQIPPYQAQSLTLTAQSQSGSEQIPIRVGIKKEWYGTEARLTRWLGYGVLLLIALAGWSYGISAIANSIVNGGSSRLRDVEWLWAILALVVPVGLYILSQRLIPQIDELETYYQRGAKVPPPAAPTFDQSRQIVVLLFTVLPGLLIGGSLSYALEGSILSGRTLWGVIGGAALAAAILLPALKWGRWLLAGIGMTLLGTVMFLFDSSVALAWAMLGIALGVTLEPVGLARRVERWARFGVRPILIFATTWIGALTGFALLFNFALSLGDGWLTSAFIYLWLVAISGVGTWLAYWVTLPAGQDWRSEPNANRPFLITALILSFLTFGLLWVLDRIAFSVPMWLMIGAQLVVLGSFVWTIYHRPDRILPFYKRSLNTLEQRGGQVNQQLSTQLHLLNTDTPFAALTPTFALSTIAALTALMPIALGMFIAYYSVVLVVVIGGLVLYRYVKRSQQ